MSKDRVGPYSGSNALVRAQLCRICAAAADKRGGRGRSVPCNFPLGHCRLGSPYLLECTLCPWRILNNALCNRLPVSVIESAWRSGRVAECDGLENHLAVLPF